MQSGVDLSSVKMSMNPFCEIAVEVRVAGLNIYSTYSFNLGFET